ncbi:FxSxx-COOH system tetratricopeptide repeat protein [Streptomyces sp. 6N223]|uniref:FxSxx-COOH system tetratricopeptide repeat protein n=1 Tax=Streptomyces sp. 6N223 TaxID=3457412 RepID=UPI003FCFAC46
MDRDAEPRQITISFAGFNRAWAAWIGDRLERQGCRVAYQRWDPVVEFSLEEALNDLLLVEGHILVVLSDWYFKLGPRTPEEWNAALRTVVAPNTHRFAAVSVTSNPMPSATAAFGGTAELWGIGAREAERRVLNLLGIRRQRDSSSSSTGVTAIDRRPGPRYPHEQPRVWSGVPRRNTRFTGREETLDDIYAHLQSAEPGAGVVTLLGMSGVGKTQISAEYVYRFGPEYDMVWWVPADQRGTLRQRLAELAPALDLSTGPDYGERLRAVREALRRGVPYGRWLLVLDGADNPGSVADLLPTGPGHVLITSQNREWAEHNTTLIEVPVYIREESVAFIRRRAPRIGPEDADTLADALGDLPLALDQTAGWLADATMTVPEYVELLRGGADLESGLRISTDFPMTYYTAFSILLNRLRETAPEAVELLRLCAMFAPGSIPVNLLRGVPTTDLPERLTGLMDDALRWNAALGKLVQHSVVRFEVSENEEDPDAAAGTVHLHRMVHQTVRDGMTEEDRDAYSRAVRRALAAADPLRPTDTRLWPRFARIVPHLEPSGALHSTHPDLHQLIFNCIRYLYLAGEYTAGIQLVERTERAWRQVLAEDDPMLWDLASQQATLIRATGDYARCERIDRAVLEHLGAARGERDPSVLRSQEGLAADLRGLGRYADALEANQRALDGVLETVGETDSRTQTSRHNLASTLRLLGRYGEAMELSRKNLADRRELLGARHGFTLLSEIDYAFDLRLLGRYAEALSVQEQSVEQHHLVMGPDNPQTLIAEQNLALCLLRLGDRAAAHARLGNLLERAERVLGDDAPLTLRIATCYSFVQRAHGNLDQAREIGESVMERYRIALGRSHPYTIGSVANHALVLRAAGERQQSLLLIEECLADMTAALGPDHPWTLGTALNASAGRSLDGDAEGAVEISRDTSRRAARSVGRKHPLFLSCQVALALDLRGTRQSEEADKVEEEALSGLIATLGSQHVHTVSARGRVRPYWDFEPLGT